MSKASEELQALIDGLEKNREAVTEAASERGWRDDRVMTVPMGRTVIRILPPIPGSERPNPWIKKQHHTFNSVLTGQLMTFDCPSTIGRHCMICQNNNRLWAANDESSKKLALKFKKKNGYAVNAYVKESKETDEVGTVKVYRFGVKVFEKLQSALANLDGLFYLPNEDGADLTIIKKIKNVGDGREFPNYDESLFVPGKSLAGSVKDQLEIIKSGYDLKEFEAKIDNEDPDLGRAFKMHVLGEDPNGPKETRPDTRSDIISVSAEDDNISDEDIAKITNFRDVDKEISEKETPPGLDEDDFDDDELLRQLEESIGDSDD